MPKWETHYISALDMASLMMTADSMGAIGWEPFTVTTGVNKAGDALFIMWFKRRRARPAPP